MPLFPCFQPAPVPPRYGARSRLLGFVIAAVAAAAAGCASAPSKVPSDRSTVGTFSAPVTDLQYIDAGVGVGAEAQPGMFVVLHYTGWIFDAAAPGYRGPKFDSSVDRNAAYGFYLARAR